MYSKRGTKVPSLEHATSREHKSEEASLAYQGEKQNTIWATTGFCRHSLTSSIFLSHSIQSLSSEIPL